MHSRFQLLLKYIQYWLRAADGKGHGIHSPFVFDFITKILNDKTTYADYGTVENLRKQAAANQSMLTIEDLGAGSALTESKQRTVSSVVKNSVKSKKYGQLLYRILRYYQPETILELGTSLGITTAYLSLACPDAKLISLEGDPQTCAVARQHFQHLNLGRLNLLQGNFDENLPVACKKLGKISFAFIDGNHRKEPTERYFREIKPFLVNDSVLIFDDIHWSREMELAWKTIQSDPQVTCSIDLFFLGIIFFRKEIREKQHFTIRF